jgi:hypothetical protein
MTSFACGIIGAALFAGLAPVLQWMARRTTSTLPPVMVLAIAALIAHVGIVAFGMCFVPQFKYWNATSIFSFGAMSYIFAFGAVYKSVSLEILLGIAERPGRAVPASEIVEHKVPEILRGRTQILVDSGLVARAGLSFSVTAAGQALADRIMRLRRLFAIGDSGLYDFVD